VTRQAGRQRSIDLLRAIAIVLMVVVHFAENLSGWYGPAGGPLTGLREAWWLPTGFAAPTFTFLSGLSYRIWEDLQRQRGWDERAITKATIRRGLFLVGLGFAFNVLVWLPEDVFNWDILTLIGVGLLAFAVARGLPDTAILAATAAIVAVAPTLRLIVDYTTYWSSGFYDYDFTLADVTIGWLVTGYFPIFPWLALPLAGYAVGRRAAASTRAALLAGGVLVTTSAALIRTWPHLPAAITGDTAQAWAMFPATTAYVLGTLGGVVLALAMAHRLLDSRPDRWRWFMDWVTPLSRHALSIYLLHHVVHVWPLWAAGLVWQGDATGLWQRAMPVAAAVALAAGFLMAAALLFRWLDRLGLPTAESTMRWLCD